MAEFKAHLLPFEERGGEKKDKILDLALLDHEIEYMTENMTLELPENFFRQRLEKEKDGRRMEKLEYMTFKLKNKFPNNIALLKSGEIVYCTAFRTTNSGKVVIDGHQFMSVSIIIIYIFIRISLCVIDSS